MNDTNELKAKVTKYQNRIGELEARYAEIESSTRAFDKIERVEIRNEINDLRGRIERLESRIAGDDPSPEGMLSDEQAARVAWAASDSYDDL